jgi:hypothetical protein
MVSRDRLRHARLLTECLDTGLVIQVMSVNHELISNYWSLILVFRRHITLKKVHISSLACHTHQNGCCYVFGKRSRLLVSGVQLYLILSSLLVLFSDANQQVGRSMMAPLPVLNPQQRSLVRYSITQLLATIFALAIALAIVYNSGDHLSL